MVCLFVWFLTTHCGSLASEGIKLNMIKMDKVKIYKIKIKGMMLMRLYNDN